MRDDILNHFEKVINDYERKFESFKLTDFERLIMLEAMKYGYEYAIHNQE